MAATFDIVLQEPEDEEEVTFRLDLKKEESMKYTGLTLILLSMKTGCSEQGFHKTPLPSNLFVTP